MIFSGILSWHLAEEPIETIDFVYISFLYIEAS